MNTKSAIKCLSAAVLAMFALAVTPAAHATSVCPTPVSATNAGLDGSSGGFALASGYLSPIAAHPSTANITCNVLITIAANGSISTSFPNGNGFYDTGGDDNVVGVINNSGSAINFLNLSSATQKPFNFEGDGICGGYNFASGPNCGANQGTHGRDNYNPSGVSFSNINAALNSGTVNFAGGIGANGGTAFFSLESPVDLNLRVSSTPEPSSLLLLGTGLFGFADVLRRRFVK